MKFEVKGWRLRGCSLSLKEWRWRLSSLSLKGWRLRGCSLSLKEWRLRLRGGGGAGGG